MELQARLEIARIDSRDDFVAWADEQSRLLEAKRYLDVDWSGVIEEIEGLASGVRSALGSQLQRIIEHLLKLMWSPAGDPRRGWRDTIIDARGQVEALLEDNPSLARELDESLSRSAARAARQVTRALRDHDELSPAVAQGVTAQRFTTEQILGDWFPDAR